MLMVLFILVRLIKDDHILQRHFILRVLNTEAHSVDKSYKIPEFPLTFHDAVIGVRVGERDCT